MCWLAVFSSCLLSSGMACLLKCADLQFWQVAVFRCYWIDPRSGVVGGSANMWWGQQVRAVPCSSLKDSSRALSRSKPNVLRMSKMYDPSWEPWIIRDGADWWTLNYNFLIVSQIPNVEAWGKALPPVSLPLYWSKISQVISLPPRTVFYAGYLLMAILSWSPLLSILLKVQGGWINRLFQQVLLLSGFQLGLVQ